MRTGAARAALAGSAAAMGLAGCSAPDKTYDFAVDVAGRYLCNVGQNSNINLYLQDFGVRLADDVNLRTVDDENLFVVIHDGRLQGVRYNISPSAPPAEGCRRLN